MWIDLLEVEKEFIDKNQLLKLPSPVCLSSNLLKTHFFHFINLFIYMLSRLTLNSGQSKGTQHPNLKSGETVELEFYLILSNPNFGMIIAVRERSFSTEEIQYLFFILYNQSLWNIFTLDNNIKLHYILWNISSS